ERAPELGVVVGVVAGEMLAQPLAARGDQLVVARLSRGGEAKQLGILFGQACRLEVGDERSDPRERDAERVREVGAGRGWTPAEPAEEPERRRRQVDPGARGEAGVERPAVVAMGEDREGPLHLLQR